MSKRKWITGLEIGVLHKSQEEDHYYNEKKPDALHQNQCVYSK